MNLFVTLLGYGLSLLPVIVTGIQAVQGDAVAGSTKKQMALDALNVALQGAASIFPQGSANGALAQASGVVAAEGITAASAIASIFAHLQTHDVVTQAVNLTRATGAYQAATAQARLLQAPAPTTIEAPTPVAN